MSKDPYELEIEKMLAEWEEDEPTQPGIGSIKAPEKPAKKLVYKQPCTSCGSKTAQVVFNTVTCDNPSCQFFKLRR